MMKLSLLAVLCFLLASISVFVFAQSDRRIFEDNPCNVPCWHGLRAGESTIFEAIKVILESDFQNFTRLNLTGTSFIYRDFQDYGLSHLRFKNGLVDTMLISGSTTDKITLQNVFDRMGEPSAISVYRILPNRPTIMRLYYSDLRMSFHMIANAETCLLTDIMSAYILREVKYDSSSATYPSEDSPGVVPPLTKEELEAWLADDTGETCYNRTAQIEATYFESDAYNLALTPQAATLQANGIRLTEAAATRQAGREMTWTAIAPTPTPTATATPTP